MELTPADVEHFWSRVDKSGECWEWQAGRTTAGYGHLWLHHRVVYAHRLSFVLAHGSIPDGLCVLHHCDNPRCVHPDHLYAGTRAQNTRDAMQRGRLVPPPRRVGEAHPQAILTRSEVIGIRQRYNAEDLTQTALAAEYGVSVQTIHEIVRRKTWKHI